MIASDLSRSDETGPQNNIPGWIGYKSTLLVGDDHPTIITFDIALYEKAVQLINSTPDFKRSILPRVGELHTAMAALRALGTSK